MAWFGLALALAWLYLLTGLACSTMIPAMIPSKYKSSCSLAYFWWLVWFIGLLAGLFGFLAIMVINSSYSNRVSQEFFVNSGGIILGFYLKFLGIPSWRIS